MFSPMKEAIGIIIEVPKIVVAHFLVLRKHFCNRSCCYISVNVIQQYYLCLLPRSPLNGSALSLFIASRLC